MRIHHYWEIKSSVLSELKKFIAAICNDSASIILHNLRSTQQMQLHASKENVYFIYDGECPICNAAANGFRIKQAVGHLNLVNARNDIAHPILKEIQEKGLDLDKGMVIKFKDTLYHGADALHIMALIGSDSGLFNRINVLLFSSKMLSGICYPILKSIRNLVLWVRGVTKINNLQKGQPIFKPIFGKEWDNLPIALQKHYANFPYSKDVVTVEGKLDVAFGIFAKILSPLLNIVGALVPYQGKGIPVIVKFRSEPNSNTYCFDREFYFPNKPVYHFRSRIVPLKGNEAIEYMRFGIGWHGEYLYENNKVVIKHKRYIWNLFGIHVPLPISLLFGKGYGEEEAISPNEFRMLVNIIHPLCGQMYEYKGTFKVVE